MSSSVVFLSAVTIDDLSLAMRAPSFPADGKASRLIFVGVCVSATACLSNTCSERAPLRYTYFFRFTTLSFYCRNLHFISVTSNVTCYNEIEHNNKFIISGLAVAPFRPCWERGKCCRVGLRVSLRSELVYKTFTPVWQHMIVLSPCMSRK